MTTILIEKDVMVLLRDGVRLATDVYRLEGATPAPALVTRTPYDKERAVAGSISTFDILRAVQAPAMRSRSRTCGDAMPPMGRSTRTFRKRTMVLMPLPGQRLNPGQTW